MVYAPFNVGQSSPAKEYFWLSSRFYQYIDLYISVQPDEKNPIYHLIYSSSHYILLFPIALQSFFQAKIQYQGSY